MTKSNFLRYFLLSHFLFFFQLIYGQKHFVPGYIITHEGDTTRGWIDYRNWRLNPAWISFSSSVESEGSKYTPNSIRGFGLPEAIYESAIIDKETSLNSFGNYKYEPAVKTEKDTVFLKTLVGGNKSLHYFRDIIGVDQFYIKRNHDYILLLFKKYLKTQQDKTIIVQSKPYTAQLKDYLKDCPAIAEKIMKSRYKRGELENVFLSYYTCINAEAGFYRKADKITSEIGLLIGIANTSLTLKSSNPLSQVDLASSTMFSGGLVLDRILPESQRKWMFHNTLYYTAYKTGGHYDDIYNPATISFAFSYLKLGSLLRYTFPVKPIAPFAGIGLSMGAPIHSKNVKIDESVFHPGSISKVSGVGGGELAYVAEIGARFNKYSLELNYEITFSSRVKRFYVLMGYKFN